MSDRPFRLTLYLTNGVEREFPVYLDAAKSNIERAVFWRPSPVNPSILEHLDERAALFEGTVLVYGGMTDKGKGSFGGIVDDTGRQWSVPARYVIAISVMDPDATHQERPRPVGFRFPPAAEE